MLFDFCALSLLIISLLICISLFFLFLFFSFLKALFIFLLPVSSFLLFLLPCSPPSLLLPFTDIHASLPCNFSLPFFFFFAASSRLSRTGGQQFGSCGQARGSLTVAGSFHRHVDQGKSFGNVGRSSHRTSSLLWSWCSEARAAWVQWMLFSFCDVMCLCGLRQKETNNFLNFVVEVLKRNLI